MKNSPTLEKTLGGVSLIAVTLLSITPAEASMKQRIAAWEQRDNASAPAAASASAAVAPAASVQALPKDLDDAFAKAYPEASASAAVAPAASAQALPKDLDDAFAKAYPETMKGSLADPLRYPHVLAQLRVTSRHEGLRTDTRESMQFSKEYIGPIVTQYMQNLKSHAAASGKSTPAFTQLWTDINGEFQDLLTGKLKMPNHWEALEASITRCVHLASSLEANEPVASSLFDLSEFKGKWISLLQASKAPVPPYLLEQEGDVPAWQHSLHACLTNLYLLKCGQLPGYQPDSFPLWPYSGTTTSGHFYYLTQNVKHLIDTEPRHTWPEPVYALIPIEGEFGLTTMVEALLQNIIAVPLTLQKAAVHTVNFSPSEMAVHDLLHSEKDPRAKVIYQEILDRLAQISEAKGYVTEGINLAVKQVEQRCRMLHDMLLESVKLQKAHFLKAPEADQQKGGIARQNYNTVISSLALMLHELYTFNQGTLTAKTFDEALDTLNPGLNFGPLHVSLDNDRNVETPAQRWSELSDPEIVTAFKAKTAAEAEKSAAEKLKLAPYADAKDWKVTRTPITLKLEAITKSGEKLTHEIATLRGLETAYVDLNNYLKPTKNHEKKPKLDSPSLKVNLERIHDFAQKVRAKVPGLLAEGLNTIKASLAESKGAYTALIAQQNAEWLAFMLKAGKPAGEAAAREEEGSAPRLPLRGGAEDRDQK